MVWLWRHDQPPRLAPLPIGAQFAIALTAALTIALGIAPGALDLLATQAARVLLP